MTAVTTASITDFLMARIDAEQAAVEKAIVEVREDNSTFYDGEYAHRDDWGLWTFHRDSARVLADCAARRAIVDLHVGGHECVGVGQFWWSSDPSDDWTQPCPTLRHLASVYADHDEFREEWKP